MKKHTVFAVIAGLFLFGAGVESLAGELSWQDISREVLDLKTVLVNPDNPDNIYIGAHNGIFKTSNGGAGWRNILSLKGRNHQINFLSFNLGYRNSLYAATGNGLFYSFDDGETWKKIFRGKNYLESECTCVVALSNLIYLGTKGGLFISKDKGRTWHKDKGVLGNSPILAIVYNAKDAAYIYAACLSGVFISGNLGQSWERIFAALVIGDVSEKKEAAEERDDDEERSLGVRHIACDPHNLNCLYLATSRGVHKSCDRGRSWEQFPGDGLLNKEVKFLLFSNNGDFYAVSKSGIFEYAAGRWQELSLGLTAQEIRSLASDNQNNLYAACDKGLFKTVYSDYKERGDLMSLYYMDIPEINEVQQAAIKYAQVEPDKIIRWRKRAARKAILPRVSVGLDRSATDLWHWESGSTTKSEDDILRKGRDAIEWDISLSWDLSELIWNDAQTSIDVRSRLMVELRDDILDEVTKLYFERIRVKMELDNISIEDRRKRFEKELKLKELTAFLDGLTGGYFSSHLPNQK
ncbi:MAG: hypothetical protein ABH806_00185 [Candidatus Omnitrophota bacterium]